MNLFGILKYLFAVVGIALLIGSVYSYNHTHDFLENAITAQGKVIDLIYSESDDSGVYKPKVTFETVDGQEISFTSSAGSNPPSYSVGESVNVFYAEATPHRAKIDGFFSLWGVALITGIIGMVFTAIGGTIVVMGVLKSREVKYLKSYGVPVNAKFQRVSRDRSTEVNGENPFEIVASWQNPVTRKIHVFKSEPIWFDPSDYIDRESVVVLIEKANPNKYFMDISFLPELAE